MNKFQNNNRLLILSGIAAVAAILAAWWIVKVKPQYARASHANHDGCMVCQSNVVRDQISLYRQQHNGRLPSVHNLWDQLLKPTNDQGQTAEGPATPDFAHGPYIQSTLNNPANDHSEVSDLPRPGIGFICRVEGDKFIFWPTNQNCDGLFESS